MMNNIDPEIIIEIVGATLALVYLILEVRQKWTMWVVGIISSLFYVYICYHAKLYALTGLNSCYVIMSSYGLYCWRFSKDSANQELKIQRINQKLILLLAGISLVLFIILSFCLNHFTDSTVPYADAGVAALSIVATWLAARKIIEHWLIWILVNYFSIGLYLYTKLYPTAILFLIYGTMSIVGWFSWKKMMEKQ